jgi:mutator protein MutT
MEYCYDCGAVAPVADGFPVCPVHGPRWKLRRNAPCADVAIERDGRLLMVRRALDPYAGCWEWPGGYMELGETPAQAAIREIREELAVEVRLTAVLGVYVDPWPNGDHVHVHTFVGEIDGEPILDAHELLEYRWFDRDDLPKGDALEDYYAGRLEAWRSGVRAPLLPGLGA